MIYIVPMYLGKTIPKSLHFEYQCRKPIESIYASNIRPSNQEICHASLNVIKSYPIPVTLGYTQIISRQNNNVWSSLFNKTGRSRGVTTSLETFETPVQRGILLSAKLLYTVLIRVFYNYQL